MWVLSGSGEQIINMAQVRRVFLNRVGDAVLVGANYGDEAKVASLGKYREMDTAKRILYDLVTAMGDGREFFIMPENAYDVIYESRIMDSRVKRRGGS
jgi:hypothetical protein